jgi:hypothetical protein
MIIPFNVSVDYRFKRGTIEQLMDLAGDEWHQGHHVTCKICGRNLPNDRQNVEKLYTCSKGCYQQVERRLVEM